MSTVYNIGSIPFYDNTQQCYTHIYIVDRQPTAPLLNITRRLTTPKLSPFQTTSGPCCNYNPCVHAIYNPNNLSLLLKIGEEALLFSYLIQNGYSIDTSLTKLMRDSPIKGDIRLLCMISK